MSLKTLLLAGVAALAAAGLAGPAAAQNREQVTLCQSLEPPVLDPTAGAAAAIREVTYLNIFEGLTALDRNGRVVPRLAESWTVSADGLTYTFTLRAGVTFHDGQPLTSEVVKFSLERATAPDSRNAQRWIFEPIERVEAVDPRTVRVVLKRPAANFLYGLAWGDAVILHPASAANAATAPVGTGPYRFGEWRRGDRLMFTRNDAYWGGAAPIPRATFRFISDPQAQVAGIQSGDCDALTNLAAQEAVEQLRRNQRLRVAIGSTEGETIVAMNNGRGITQDVRVRRAISAAIDRRLVNEGAISGFGVPIGSHFSPNHPAFVDLTPANPFDPARARALLREAGVAEGTTLTLALPPPAYARRGGEIVAAMLQQVGIRTTIVPLEWPQWLERVFRGRDYDLTIIAHVEPLDIEIYARPDYYFQYRNDAFNAMIREATQATNAQAQTAAYQAAQRKLAEDAVNVFLFMLPKITVTQGALQGMWESWPLPANPLAELRWQ
jgi:peptide/nickel transport system substrate-binding protein